MFYPNLCHDFSKSYLRDRSKFADINLKWHEFLYFELWGLNFELYDMYL